MTARSSAAKTDDSGRKVRQGNRPASVRTSAQQKAGFKKGNSGRPRGSKNKVTVAQRETARQMFTPLAELGLKTAKKHLEKCKIDGCVSCFQWTKMAAEYAYGKPTQPLEFDPVALRTELESIAVAANKSVEQIEQEAYEAGVRVLADHSR